MIEQQPTSQCLHCGYPVEIGEHAPNCPNKPGKGVEADSSEQLDLQQETEAAQTPEVFESLNPQEITDAEGVERKIYSFTTATGKEVKVLFYAPDELPFSEEMVKERQGFIIGNPPASRSKEDWTTFREQIRQHSSNDTSPTTQLPVEVNEPRAEGIASFFVESSPQAILDMAFYLGVEDKKLREMRRLLAQGETNDEIESLMDKVIAGKVIDKDGALRSERNDEGEALVLMALQGNEAAQNELQRREELLGRHDEALTEEKASEIAKMAAHAEKTNPDIEPLEIDSLVAVHTTKYKPKRQGDGYSMQTTFDGSKGDTLRNTAHFTLNHHVSSHMSGNWDHSPYVVLAPLSEMIEKNGKPKNINTVDTYFEQNPNQPVELPEGTSIIEPGSVEPGELFRIQDDGSVLYQKEEFVGEDIKAITNRYDSDRQYSIETNLVSAIENAIRSRIRFEDDELNGDYEERYRLSSKVSDAMQELWEQTNWQAALFEKFEENGIEYTIGNLLDSAGIGEKLQPAEKSQVVEAVHAAIRSDIKILAVKETIKHMGYENHRGGMWAWDGDSFDATDATTKLAHAMGVDTGPHGSTPGSEITHDYYTPMSELKEGKIGIKEYREESERVNARHLDKISPKTRRMLYQRGLL